MSAVEFLINFVNARLSAAVDEIFTVFENTIVRYEQDIARQRRLLESFWKPEIKLRRIDHPQLRVSTAEKVLPTKQLCNQERNSSLDQEEPGPPQEEHEDLLTSQEEPELPRIKEQQELFSSQEGAQLALKLETYSFMGTPIYQDCKKQEPNMDQLLSHSSSNRSLEGHKHVDSGSAANEDRKPRKKRRRNQSDRNCEENCHMSKSRHHGGKKVCKM
ncbi:uncharacterized protein LOC115795879 [Archocentrus centrarchus]|uniref:uncharacterized protein LOC115795879 n=1 Tax=Archocentrus centrarchus TaxID=63155 RepID=UPI0011EA15DE|nr:uncharacterized protein LOC115795879 [Archocentrus centrarchus]